MAQSLVAYYPSYWNTSSETNEKPPTALIALYKEIVHHFKAAGRTVKTEHRTYYLGVEAEKLRIEGMRLVGVD